MEVKIKILIAEHDAVDLEMIHRELQKSGIGYLSQAAANEQDYINALQTFIPDIILADYTFPSFDGPTAFKLREKIAGNTPFIFVSGTIGEERSIELIRSGVTDYCLKDSLFTLNHKIHRALEESKARQQKIRTEQALIQHERRLARIQLMAQIGNLLIAQESERANIGNELNENLNQILAAAKMYVELSRKQKDKSEVYLELSSGLIQEVMMAIRKISKTLIIPDYRIARLKKVAQ